MSEYIKISPEIRALGREAEREIRPYFERLEEICDRNTEKVLAAFAKNRVSDNLFAGTTRSTPIFSAPRPHSCVSAL